MKRIAVFFLSVFCVVQSQAQVALTPATPAISPAPVFVPGSPALTPIPANPGVTTNASLVPLSAALLSLQANLEQTLPAVISFNNSFDFANLASTGLGAVQNANPPGNFSANLATNFAANYGVSLAVPIGPPLFNSAANLPPTPPATAGVPPGFAANLDTLRALWILQNDMQRVLTLVNALNAGAVTSPGSITNLFGVIPASR